MFNSTGSENVAILGVLAPAEVGIGAVTTDYISVKDFDQVMVIVTAGVLGLAGTLDAILVQATSDAGAGSKPVTGKAITQMVKATDDGKQAIINLRTSELDITGGFYYVAVTVTVAGAASLASVVVLGLGGRYKPATNYDASTVNSVT